MTKSIIFLFVLFLLTSANAQQFTNWQNHTNLKDVRDVHISGNDLWAVSSGGAFKYSITDQSIKTFVKSDGLQGISLSAITVDNYGKVWLGSSDGVLNVYDPVTGKIKVILDIFISNQNNKQINNLEVSGDTIIASTDFGVSLIDAKNYLFYDTFSKFGIISPYTRVNFATKSDLIYVSTDAGVAIQKPGATNLSAPESWNVYQTTEGLPSNKIYKVDKYGNDLIAATDLGMAVFSNNSWQSFLPDLVGMAITDFTNYGNDLYLITGKDIYQYANSQLNVFYSSAYNFGKVDTQIGIGLAASSDGGLFYHDLISNTKFILPNGPAANQFPSLSAGSDGVLWSASGKDGRGVGFYNYDRTEWFNYSTGNTPELPGNDVYVVFATTDHTAYLGTWGSGALEVKDGAYTLFNRESSGMQGIPENLDFLVITGFAKDSKNNLWLLNYASADKKNLSMRTPENNWYHFNVPVIGNLALNDLYSLDTDQYDTKWFVSQATIRSGIFYFNENKTYDDPADDRSGYLTTSNGLNSNDISSLVVDDRGDVWVGTTAGVNVITNVGGILSGGTSSLKITSVFTVRQQSVTAIAVDPLNQKWIGTTEGLLLLNSDGSRLLATFNSKNSALLSDQIESIAIDATNGIVYVGTEQGLTSFETPYLKPLESFDKLFVFPNPFIVKDNSKLLVIDGLIKDCDIKILSVTGNLVAEFSSPGGRTAYWDGIDKNGKLVDSGVYIIVAFDQEGNSVTTGKVAVLRE
jgi:ligand-binding sensor domain-containing protein